MDARPKTACNTLMTVCSDCKTEENILFVTDATSMPVAQLMWSSAGEFKNKAMIVMDERIMHGQEPPELVATAMAKADVIFGITKYSLFHTDARRSAVGKGARFINMVDYHVSMMESGGLFADFIAQGMVCTKIAEDITGQEIIITSEKGTYLTANVSGKKAVPQYGRSVMPGATSSPPDIECAIGPIETSSNGIIYVDGSIPHPELGLIHDEIKLTVENGRIVKFSGGPQAMTLEKIVREANSPNAYFIGEIGIGLNPQCILNGRMLEDEGCMGTVHFGLGNSRSFFGSIDGPFHLDMVIKSPTISVDGRTLLDNGKVLHSST